LTLADGIKSFDRLIPLNEAGTPTNQLPAVDTRIADRAWCIDVRRKSAVPIIPFVVPTEAWCDAVIRTFASGGSGDQPLRNHE